MMKLVKIGVLVTCLFAGLIANGQTVKILFDASKAEAAGNADWVIDANTHTIGFFNGPAVLGQGTESNAQRIPSPSQANITSSSPETYWQGALSYWAVDCVNRGYIVESLPYNGRITYGDSTNLQDLSTYRVFIICEPNILFTNSEKTAIINFVANGGGLFMISDHDISDRNGDGADSPFIWNDLLDNNSFGGNPFGISFDYDDFSQTSSNIPSLIGDSILNGPFGNVSRVQWNNGTTMSLNPIQNSTVVGAVYKTGSAFGNNNVLCAYSRFGNGRVAALGDSSPCDDGTGDVNDQLYDGYIADASGNHRKLLMNITIWLAAENVTTSISDFGKLKSDLVIYPNPACGSEINLKYPKTINTIIEIQLIDATGKVINTFYKSSISDDNATQEINISNIENGFYICRFISESLNISKSFIVRH